MINIINNKMMNKANNAWESHLYFGKLSKTPEMNMACFIIGILSQPIKVD